MDVFVPERFMVRGNGYPYHNYLTGHSAITNYCVQHGAYEKIESYFYDTKLRTVNDCVHGKLVNPEGITPKVLSALLPNGKWVDWRGHSATRAWVTERNYVILLICSASRGGPKGKYYTYRSHILNVYMFRPESETSHRYIEYNLGSLTFVTYFEALTVKLQSVPKAWEPIALATGWAFMAAELAPEWIEDDGIHPRTIPETGEWSGLLLGILDRLRPQFVAAIKNGSTKPFSANIVSGLPEQLGDPSAIRSRFIMHEPELIVEGIDPLLVNLTYWKDTSAYWRNWLIQHAFLDACDHIPRLNDNSISNIIEITQFIYALVVKHQIEIPKSLGDAWLTYRYAYSTSMLDAREAINFVHRHMDLKGDFTRFRCHGQASHTTEDGVTVTCRCTFRITQKELSQLDRIWESLYRYGLEPNFYVIWDMIPFSFMVDWFIPIGDAVSVFDARRHYSSDHYDFDHICYSLSYIVHKDDFYTKHYARWDSGSTPPELQGYYWFDKEKPPSDRTIGYRVLDVLSIVLG